MLLAAVIVGGIAFVRRDPYPDGWSKVSEAPLAPTWMAIGVGTGNGVVSVTPGHERVGDSKDVTFGVHVVDDSTLENEFIVMREPDEPLQNCTFHEQLTVGPAGFVLDYLNGVSDNPSCLDETVRHTLVSSDGYDWTPVDVGADAIVVAGVDSFLQFDGNTVADAVTGAELSPGPDVSGFNPRDAAVIENGTTVLLGASDNGWVSYRREDGGDWEPIDSNLLRRSSGRLQSMGDSFMLVGSPSSSFLAARSLDGTDWTEIDPGPDWGSSGDLLLRYASPGRVLGKLVDGGCALECGQDRYVEFTADSTSEVLVDHTAEGRTVGSGPFVSVNDEGYYTRAIESDDHYDLVSMTDRDESPLLE